MKKDYLEIDIQLLYLTTEDIVTLSAGEFDDNNPEQDKVGDDIFNT